MTGVNQPHGQRRNPRGSGALARWSKALEAECPQRAAALPMPCSCDPSC